MKPKLVIAYGALWKLSGVAYRQLQRDVASGKIDPEGWGTLGGYGTIIDWVTRLKLKKPNELETIDDQTQERPPF